MAEVLTSGRFAVYRVVVKLEDEGACEKAGDRVSELEVPDGFVISWFPRGNVLEVLVKWKIPDAARFKKEALEDADNRLKAMFSFDGIVEGFIECYRLESTMELVPRR
jgi:hypothetical protein